MAKKYRVAGGLQVVQDGYLIGPVRGPKAPRMPSSLDISGGLMEPDEGMKSTQVREGAEEIIRLKDGKVHLPDIVNDAEVLEHVTATIADAIEDPESPIEEGFPVEFYESEVRVPTNTREIWIQGHSLHDWETGVTIEERNSPSYELLAYLVENPEDDMPPLDTEVVHGDQNNWLNRHVYKFHPMTGDAEVYRSGEKVFAGSFSEMTDFLSEELGEEVDFTIKVKASIEGLPTEKGDLYEEIDIDEEVREFFNLGKFNN
jgi:hypothetical protein